MRALRPPRGSAGGQRGGQGEPRGHLALRPGGVKENPGVVLRGRAVGQAAFPKPPARFLRQHTASPAQVRPPPEGGKGREGSGAPRARLAGEQRGGGVGCGGRQAGRKEKTSEQGERREPKRS